MAVVKSRLESSKILNFDLKIGYVLGNHGVGHSKYYIHKYILYIELDIMKLKKKNDSENRAVYQLI